MGKRIGVAENAERDGGGGGEMPSLRRKVCEGERWGKQERNACVLP